MAPQRRKYPNDSDRQRAYRERNRERLREERERLVRLGELVEELGGVVHQAAAVGEPVAARCDRADGEELLRALVDHFRREVSERSAVAPS